MLSLLFYRGCSVDLGAIDGRDQAHSYMYIDYVLLRDQQAFQSWLYL